MTIFRTDEIINDYQNTRAITERICQPLPSESYDCQPAEFTSPPKWHLAHSTWFFEEFILRPYLSGYQSLDNSFRILFNSYYKSQGEHLARNKRGQLTRPQTSEINDYRRHVDSHVKRLFSGETDPEMIKKMILGIHHEQQHQELLLMDIKYILSRSPISISYNRVTTQSNAELGKLGYIPFEGGLTEIGTNGVKGFAFDNEMPNFKFYQQPFFLANRPITNGEYLSFMNDGGYKNPLLWKSDGWDYINNTGDDSPMYWINREGEWLEFTLNGIAPLQLENPVCHISFYEADAFAEWSGARLPTEMELEQVYNLISSNIGTSGFFESEKLHPSIYPEGDKFFSLTGNLWEWTSSAYLSYPGYKRPNGAFGEYNQKFMVNQMVLRGGCVATPRSHFRPTYRNFFYPNQKWAFTGLRLAKDRF